MCIFFSGSFLIHHGLRGNDSVRFFSLLCCDALQWNVLIALPNFTGKRLNHNCWRNYEDGEAQTPVVLLFVSRRGRSGSSHNRVKQRDFRQWRHFIALIYSHCGIVSYAAARFVEFFVGSRLTLKIIYSQNYFVFNQFQDCINSKNFFDLFHEYSRWKVKFKRNWQQSLLQDIPRNFIRLINFQRS